MQNLEKEYLKMNRLTQKIVNYFLTTVGRYHHDKFLTFLTRVIFGEHLESSISCNKVSPIYFQVKERFRIFVHSHLKAAEELTQTQKRKSSDGNKMQIINNRLGNLLFPPERAIKFNSILNDSNLTDTPKRSGNKTEKITSNSKMLSLQNKVNGENKHENEANCLIIPTVRKISYQSHSDMEIKPQKQPFKNDVEERVNYLHYQINYYQQRLQKFYKKLYNYAKFKKEKSLEDMMKMKNLTNIDYQKNQKFVPKNILTKRSYPSFKASLPFFPSVKED